MRLALVLACLAAWFAPASAGELPGDSIYQLEAGLITQENRKAGLDLHRGHPTVISMFYGSCPHVCPTLISTIQRMENTLDDGGRKRLRVLLVSIDPQRDTPAALSELARKHGADLSRWTFAQMPAASVRQLAAVLGIQYRQLPDGEFNHSTVITLLDGDGRIVGKTSQLGRLDEHLVAHLRAATAD
jgi:protein SCO1